jgi:hypothetical protein
VGFEHQPRHVCQIHATQVQVYSSCNAPQQLAVHCCMASLPNTSDLLVFGVNARVRVEVEPVLQAGDTAVLCLMEALWHTLFCGCRAVCHAWLQKSAVITIGNMQQQCSYGLLSIRYASQTNTCQQCCRGTYIALERHNNPVGGSQA